MSIIYFDPGTVRLKKFAATTTSGSKKTTSVVRIEFMSSDPYAIASIISQLEEADREQRASDELARQAAKPAPRSRGPRRLAGAAPVLMLPYHGESE